MKTHHSIIGIGFALLLIACSGGGGGPAAVATGNVAPVITSNGGGATAAVNAAENQTLVTTLTSTDVDAGDGKTFTLSGGADSALFALNASTGALTFVSARDFETMTDVGANGVYDVQVTVTDSAGLTDVQDIAVTVTNVNEAPEITSNAGGAAAALNVAENQTVVTTLTSTDVDAGDGKTFTLTGGADSALFALNASTGALTFVSARDFETMTDAGANGVYDVQVTVTDSAGLTDVQDIAVTVTPVASALSFPLRALFSALFANGHTKNFSVSGTCSGTAIFTQAAAVGGATFEGVAGQLSAARTLTMILPNCTPAFSVSTSTIYYDTNFAPLGFSSPDGGYGVFPTPAAMPISAIIGGTDILGTLTNYTDSTKSVSLGQTESSYVIEPDTATTAIANVIGKVFNATHVLTSTEQDRYRISATGAATLISIDTQSANGSTTHLVFQ